MPRKPKKETTFEESSLNMDDLRRKFPKQSERILAEIYANELLKAENLDAESTENETPEP